MATGAAPPRSGRAAAVLGVTLATLLFFIGSRVIASPDGCAESCALGEACDAGVSEQLCAPVALSAARDALVWVLRNGSTSVAVGVPQRRPAGHARVVDVAARAADGDGDVEAWALRLDGTVWSARVPPYGQPSSTAEFVAEIGARATSLAGGAAARGVLYARTVDREVARIDVNTGDVRRILSPSVAATAVAATLDASEPGGVVVVFGTADAVVRVDGEGHAAVSIASGLSSPVAAIAVDSGSGRVSWTTESGDARSVSWVDGGDAIDLALGLEPVAGSIAAARLTATEQEVQWLSRGTPNVDDAGRLVSVTPFHQELSAATDGSGADAWAPSGTVQVGDIMGGWGNGITALGDVDGDGIVDMAIGLQGHYAGSATNAGAVLILRQDAAGKFKLLQRISTAEGLIGGASIPQENLFFGGSLVGLDDVDDDQVPELAVGAYGTDANAGAVWILRLTALGEARTAVEIGSDEIGAISNDDLFGIGMCSLPDLDGDGRQDLAVGAYRDDTGGTHRGAVYLLFLNADDSYRAYLKIDETGALGWNSIDGIDMQRFGSALAAVPWPGNNGKPLLVAGAYLDSSGAGSTGAAYAMFLSTEHATVSVSRNVKLANGHGGLSAVLTLAGGMRWGSALAFVGDLDGDGASELAVGARNEHAIGFVDVVFLNDDATARAGVRLSVTSQRLPADALSLLCEECRFGASVVALPHPTRADITVLAIGAPNYNGADQSVSGGALVIHIERPAEVYFDTEVLELSTATQGSDPGDWAPSGTTNEGDELGGWGNGIAPIDDVDQDGVPDLVVGASGKDGDKGSVFILRRVDARGSGFVLLQTIDEENGHDNEDMSLPSGKERFGRSVVGMADVDDDGIPELAVGAPGSSGWEGSVWVLRLTDEGKARTAVAIDNTELSGSPLEDDSYFGYGLCEIDDLDGDGRRELVAGSYGDSSAADRRGAVYILFLAADDSYRSHTRITDDGLAGWTSIDGSDDQRFGSSVAALAVPLIGASVVIAVGTPDDRNGGSDTGAVYLLGLTTSGGADRVVTNVKLSATHGGVTEAGIVLDDNYEWGSAVARVSDLDGDGIDELFVGARNPNALGLADIVFLKDSGEARTAVRLADSPSSLLPDAAKSRISSNALWGASVAELPVVGSSERLLVIAAGDDDTGGNEAGAVFVIRMAGGSVLERSVASTDPLGVVDGDPVRFELPPAAERLSGLAVLTRVCDATCGGDCLTRNRTGECDTQYGCAAGYVAVHGLPQRCCAVAVDGRMPFVDPATQECGFCHVSCAACDGPLPTQCLTGHCTPGYYWTGSECALIRACSADEYEVAAPTSSTDRQCVACHNSCFRGIGCTGPLQDDCTPAVLSGVGNEVVWVSQTGDVSAVAARITESRGASVITHIDVNMPLHADPASSDIGTAWALRSDGTVWSATLNAEAVADAALLASVHERCVALTAGAARLGLLYVATASGAVMSVGATSGVVTRLTPASVGATAVAACAHAADANGIRLMIGTQAGAVLRARSDGARRVAVVANAGAAVQQLSVDAAHERVVWGVDGDGDGLSDEVASASWEDGSDLRVLAEAARPELGGLSVVVNPVDGADVRFLAGSQAPVRPAEHLVVFNEDVGVVEASYGTEGSDADSWAEAGTTDSYDHFGQWYNSVANIGDIDGDGMPDIGVGSPGHSIEGVAAAGALLILRQLSSGHVKLLQRISAEEGIEVGSGAALPAQDIHFGCSVVGMGDVDGNGIEELLVGADRTSSFRGAVYVVRVNAEGLAVKTTLISNDQMTGSPLSANDRFGVGMTALPDLDLDGRLDVAVGAFGAKRVYILLLNSDDSYRVHISIANGGSTGWHAIGDPDSFGNSIAHLLWSRDGDRDVRLAVGCRRDDDGGVDAGAVYVLTLVEYNDKVHVESSAKLSAQHGGVGNAGVVPQASDKWGTSVASLDDLDGDGASELLVSAPEGGTYGYVSLLFLWMDGTVRTGLQLAPLAASVLPEALRVRLTTVGAAGSMIGTSITAIPSAVIDGAPALVMAASIDGGGGSLDQGAVFVVHMAPRSAVAFTDDVQLMSVATQGDEDGAWAPSGTITAADALGSVATGVAVIDDVDQDGHHDLVIGTPGHSSASTANVGAVLVLRLSVNGTAQLLQRISADEGLAPGSGAALGGSGEGFGGSVAPLKDRDGDGVPELAVGAYATDASTGSIWVLRLTSAGMARSAVRIGNDEMRGRPLDAGDHFGLSMCAVPDVNGDGREEVGVGAYLDDDAGTSRGAFYVVFLTADDGCADFAKISDATRSSWTTTQGVDNQLFGFSSAAIAGVDAPFVAVAVSAMWDPDGGAKSGAVFVLAFTMGGGGAVDHSIKLGGAHEDLLRLGVAPVASDRWGAGVSAVPDLDGDGTDELLVGARRIDGYGFADLLFLAPNGAPRAAVRLSRFASSPLPVAAKQLITSGARFGTSTAAWRWGADSTSLAIVAANTPEGGAVVVVTLARGTELMRVQDASEQATTKAVRVTAWSPGERALGLATSTHACFEGCGGGCTGPLPTDCADGSSCAAGYARTADASNACCPAPSVAGDATFFDAQSGTCGGDCHASCAACDGSGELSCLPERCAVDHWWTGTRCSPHTTCNSDEYEVTEPSALADRECGACHASCVAGAACTGPLFADCLPLSLSATGDALVWITADGDTSHVAATLPSGAGNVRIADVDAEVALGEDGGAVVAVWALRADGTVWAAELLPSSTPVAQQVADVGVPAVSMSAGAVRRGWLFVVTHEGSIYRIDAESAAMRPLVAPSTQATAVAATPYPADATGVLIAYGTSSGALVRASGDASMPVVLQASGDAVNAVALDAEHQRVVWSAAGGALLSASWVDGSDMVLHATDLFPVAGAVTSFASFGAGGTAASVDIIHGALPPVYDAADVVLFDAEVVEVSHATTGDQPEDWAPSDTLEETGLMGGGGSAIATIDDVDLDGLSDMVVGVPLYSTTSTSEVGEVLVLRRLSSGNVKLLRRLNSEEGFVGVPGPPESASLYFGAALAGMKDIDSDDVPELAVGAQNQEGGGAVWILNLRTDGQVHTSNRIRLSDVLSSATVDADKFGVSLCAIPDIDGDGQEELGVGAYHDDDAGDNRGAVYLLFLQTGSTGLRTYVKIANGGSAGWKALSASNNQLFGSSVAPARLPLHNGPVLLVGVIHDDDGGQQSGAAYVLFLTEGSTDVKVERSVKYSATYGGLAEAGIAPTQSLGWGACVTTLSDIDGDGVDEFLVGASGDVLDVLFVSPSAELLSAVRLSAAATSPLPVAMRDRFPLDGQWGRTVVELPPLVDGEPGVLAVSAPLDDAGGLLNSGSVFLLTMVRPSRLRFEDRVTELSSQTAGVGAAPWAPAGTVLATDEMGGFGNGIASLDDVDQDGIGDIAIGVRHMNSAVYSAAGGVLILRMLSNGNAQLLQRINSENGLVPGSGASIREERQYFGASIAGLHDDDGDGLPELAVGAIRSEEWRGAIWLLRLTSSGSARTAVRIGNGDMDGSPLDPSDYFGQGMAALPDLDGDGRQEIAVGAYADDDGGANRGAVYIMFVTADHSYRSHTKLSQGRDAGWSPINENDEQFFGFSIAAFNARRSSGGIVVFAGAVGDSDGFNSAGAVYGIEIDVLDGTSEVRVTDNVKLSAVEGGASAAGVVFHESGWWGSGVSVIDDLDDDGSEELFVGASASQSYGFADVLFLHEDGTVRSSVRLSDSPASPLPLDARNLIEYDARWGSSTAMVYRDASRITLAVASVAYTSSTGAVFLVHMSTGSKVLRSTATYGPSGVVAEAEVVATFAPTQPAGGLAQVVRACDVGCAGDCPGGPTAADCDALVGCAQGYVATTDEFGACCPESDSGAAGFYDPVAKRCGGFCHESCAACDGPSAGSCLPQRCAAGYWWSGLLCLPHSPPCRPDQFIVNEPSDSADRGCRACSDRCVPGFGCSGPEAEDCATVALTAEGDTLVWVVKGKATWTAAALPAAEGNARVVDVGLHNRVVDGNMTAWALRGDGSIWAANVSHAVTSVAVKAFSAGKPCVAMSVGAASMRALYVVSLDGDVGKVATDTGTVTWLDVSGVATAVAATTVADGASTAVRLWFGTSSGVIHGCAGDGGNLVTVVSALGATVTALSVDPGSERVLWSTSSGGFASAGWDDGAALLEVATDMRATVSANAAASRSGGSADALALSAALPPITSVDTAMTFEASVAELSVATEGSNGWAPAATLSEGDEFGSSGNGISPLDDINGDGLEDMVVGVRSHDVSAVAGAGAVLVLTMRVDGGARLLQRISAEEGTEAGVVLDEAASRFGSSVVGLHDADADGLPELAVGGFGADNDAGAVWVLRLTAAGVARAAVRIGGAALAGSPLEEGDKFGWGLCALPDMDGDGRQELAVGAVSDGDGGLNRGAVYVLFLNDDDTYRAHSKISGDGVSGWAAQDPSSPYHFGSGLASWRSVDEGWWLGVGAMSAADGGAAAGALYNLRLAYATMTGVTVSDSVKISGTTGGLAETTGAPPEGSLWGSSVAAVPDVDGDGIDELLVGARPNGDLGFAYVLFLREDGTMRDGVVLSQAEGSPLPSAASQRITVGSLWGSSVAAVRGRGAASVPALAVAAMADAPGGTASGAVYILQLRAPSPLGMDDDFFVEVSKSTEGAGEDAWAPQGTLEATDFAAFGDAITLLGDVDQDGIADMAVGEHAENGGVYVLRRLQNGAVKLLQRIAEGSGIAAGLDVELNTASALFGDSVAGLEDVDGDNVPELAVGAPVGDVVWVMRLNPAGEARTAVSISADQLDGVTFSSTAYFGTALCAVPDIDGDGRQELLVGALVADGGAVFVVFLRADDAYRTHVEISESSGVGWAPIDGHADDQFGYSCTNVAPIGGGAATVVAVSANTDSDTVTQGGAVYLLALEAGTAHVASFTKLSGAHGGLAAAGVVLTEADQWGSSVASMGDVDSDGNAELLVGASVINSVGYVDIVFLNGDLTARASVRLSVDPTSPLPSAARDRMTSGGRWGGSVGFLGVGQTGQLELAIAAPLEDVGGDVAGSLFLLRVSPGALVQRWRTTGPAPPGVSGEPSTVQRWPPAATRPAGLHAASHVCSAGCAGSCLLATSPMGCDASAGCATGYHLVTSDVDDVCLPEGVDNVDAAPTADHAPAAVEIPSGSRVIALTDGTDGGSVAYVGGRTGSALLTGFDAEGATVHAFADDTAVAGVAWADVDVDGTADLLVARNRHANRLYVQGASPSQLTDEAGARGFADVSGVLSMAVGDCDGDRDVDVVMTAPQGYNNTVMVNDGNGYLTRKEDVGDFSDPLHDGGAMALFDVDDDGDLDVLLARFVDGVALFINDGACTFASASLTAPITTVNAQLGASALLASIVLVDADADGHLDALVVPSRGAPAVLSFHPALTSVLAQGIGQEAFAAAVGDLRGQGHQEVLLATPSGVRVIDGALRDDVTGDVLQRWGATDEPVALAAAVPLRQGVGLLTTAHGGGGLLYAPVYEDDAGSGTLLVRVTHRLGVSHHAVFGAVARLSAGGETLFSARVVDASGAQVQASAVVRFAGLDAARQYTLHVDMPTRDGVVPWVRHNVTANGTARVKTQDMLITPTLSASPSSGCVAIGQTLAVTATMTSREAQLTLAPASTLNEANNTRGALSAQFTDVGAGVYRIEYTVQEGSPDWPQNDLPVWVVLQDPVYGVQSRGAAWPAGEPVACGDGTRPVALFDVVPPLFTRDSDAQFGLSCTELHCAYDFSLDDGPWQSINATQAGDGEGADADADALLPPATRLLAAPALFSSDRDPVFEVAVVGAEPEATEFSVDGGATWLPAGSTQLQLFGLNDGEHGVKLRAGPADASPSMYTWEVDTKAPVLSIVSGPTDDAGDRVAFVVSLSEEGGVARYRMHEAPLPGDGADSTREAAQAALEAAEDGVAGGEWNTTADTVLLFTLRDGFAYQLEVQPVDRAGNEGGVRRSAPFARPRCAAVPPATLVAVHEGPQGPVLRFEVASPLLQARMRRHDGAWGDWRTTAARLVDSATLRGDATTPPGTLNAIEARAFTSCTPHDGVPPPARYEWMEPVEAEPLQVVIASAPLAVTTRTTARFRLSTTRPGEQRALECAYGFSPTSSGIGALRFAGGDDDGRAPLWRPCGPEYVLEPLQVGRHRLLARVKGADDSEAQHDWTVQSSEASQIFVFGRDTGNHNVRIRATDRAGNKQSAEPHVFSWEVDRVAPDTAAVRMSPFHSNADAVEVAVSCLDELLPESCSFCWTSATLSNGCSDAGVSTISIPVPRLPQYERPHEVFVAALDGAGNEDDSPVPLYWTTDRVPPEVNLTIDASRVFEGSWWTPSTRPSLSFVADEALVSAQLSLDSSPARAVPLDESVNATALPVLDDAAPPLRHGDAVVVQFTATDLAGNVDDASRPLRVEVDTVAPSASMLNGPPRRVNETSATLVVSGVAEEDDALVAFHFTYEVVEDRYEQESAVDDDAWLDAGDAAAHIGPSTLAVEPFGARGAAAQTRVDLSGMQHGHVYFVYAATEDVAGNVGNATLLAVFSVDVVAPTSRIEAPAGDVSADASVVAIDVEASEPGCTASMTVLYQGFPVAVASEAAGDKQRALRVQAGGLSLLDGEYVAEVRLVDAAGNAAVAPAVHHFTVDTRDPVLSATLPLTDTLFTASASLQAALHCDDATECIIAPQVTSGGLSVVDELVLAGGASDELQLVANAEGPQALTLDTEDAAGNAGEPVALQWVFDETPPWMRVLLLHGDETADDGGTSGARALPDADSGAFDWMVDTSEQPLAQPLAAFNAASPAIAASCGDPPFGSQCDVSLRLSQRSSTRVSCSADDSATGSSDGGGAGGGGAAGGGVDATAAPYADWGQIAVGPGAEATLLLPELADGEWRAEFAAADEAGNVQTNASTVYTWFVDTVAPARPVLLPEDDNVREASSTTAPSLTVDVALADDFSPLLDQAAVLYTIDVAEEAQTEADVRQVEVRVSNTGAIEATLTVRNLDEGAHDLRVWVVDAAGNAGPAATLAWTRDGKEPDTRLLWRPAEVIAWSTVPFTLQMLDANGNVLELGAHVEVQVQGLFQEWRAMCDAKDATSLGTILRPGVCSVEIEAEEPGTYLLQARTVNALGQADGDPVSARWTRHLCGRDEFAAINATSGAIVCGACPAGADCTDPLVSRDAVQAKPGFWTPPGSSDFDFYECVLDSCLGARAGPNGTVLPSGCKEGYTGRLCSLCDDGFFMQFRRCLPCPTTYEGSVGAIVGIAVALIVSSVVVFYIRNVLPISVGKVVVSFLQVVGSANVAFRIKWPSNFEGTMNAMKVAMLDVLTLTRASCAAPMTFYDSFAVTLSIFVGLSVVGVAAMVWFDARSRKREKDQLRKMLTARMTALRAKRAVMPPGIGEDADNPALGEPPAASLTSASAAPMRGPRRAVRGTARRGGRQRQRKARRSTLAVAADAAGVGELNASLRSLRWAFVFKRLSQFWLLCYPGVSVKLMRVFKCTHIQSRWYLEADMRLECFTGEWAVVAVISAVTLVAYTVGLPLGIALWLRSRRRDIEADSAAASRDLGFLYELYGTKHGQYMWEVAELVRKLILTSLVLFFSAGSPFQVCFALVVSAYAHVAHALYRPFVDRATYLLQHGSLAVTTFVFAMGMLFKVDGFGASSDDGGDDADDTDTVVSDADTAVLEALGMMLVVAVSGFLVWAFVVAVLQVRRKLANRDVRAALGGGVAKLRLISAAFAPRKGSGAAGAAWGAAVRANGRPARGKDSNGLELQASSPNLSSIAEDLEKTENKFVRSNPLWSRGES